MPQYPGIFAAAGVFPHIADTNTSAETTATDTHTVALPPNIAAGDRLMVVFGIDSGNTFTPPAGWNTIAETNNGPALLVLERQADGGEGASITVTSSQVKESAHISLRIAGDDATQAPEASAIQRVAPGTQIDPPALDPTGATKDFLWLVALQTGDGDATYTGLPANYTSVEISNSPGTDGTFIQVVQRKLTAATEDPGQATASSSNNLHAVTMAVHP